jgi:hypothetical protein
MARGNQQTDNYTNFYVKLVGLKKGSKECFFEFKKKEGDKYVVVENNSSFDGNVEKISYKEIEVEGKKKPILEVILRDDYSQERYYLNLGMSNISRQLISCLTTADKIESLSFWTKMGDNGFPVFVTKANGNQDKLQWGLDMKALSEKYVTEHKIAGDIIRDYSELDKYLLGTILPTVIEKVVGLPKASIMTAKDPIEQVTKEDIYKASEESTSEEEDDDLPF